MSTNRVRTVAANGRQSSSAKNQDQRDALVAYYEELNALWNQAEAELAAMRFPHAEVIELPTEPVPGSEEYSDWLEHELFGFVNKDGRWRICHGLLRKHAEVDEIEPEESFTPLAECSMEKRIEMVPYFRELRDRLQKAKDSYLPRVANAVKELREALAD